MDIKNGQKILDAMQMTGIYVIREEDHGILYYNRRVKEVAPHVQVGTPCHQLFSKCCSNCPLITIGNRYENRSITYGSLFGDAADIVATRIQWENQVPAFLITVTPHLEASVYSYHKILRANLSQDTYNVIKANPQDLLHTNYDTQSLSQWLRLFVRNGHVHKDDIRNFLAFTQAENLKSALRSGQKILSFVYRRKSGDGFRWNIMEVVPDTNCSDTSHTIMLYIKDIHEIYRESIEREEIHLRNQEIIHSLGEQNFFICIIGLETGIVNPVRMDKNLYPDAMMELLQWDAVIESYIQPQIHEGYRHEFLQKFSLESIRKARLAGIPKVDFLCLQQIGGWQRYVSVTAHLSQKNKETSYVVLAMQDVDERIHQELEHRLQDMRLAAIVKSRYSMMNTVHLDTGQYEPVWLGEGKGLGKTAPEDYRSFFERALSTFVYEEDRQMFQKLFSLEHLREKAAETENYLEEACQFRIQNGHLRWIESRILYIRQEDNTMVNILGRDITRKKFQEEERLRSAQEKAYIISGLSSMFFSTYYIDLEYDTFRTVTQRREVGQVLGNWNRYSSAIHTYAEHFIHPEDSKEYLSVMDPQNLVRTLNPEHHFVAVEYRQKRKGGEGAAKEDQWIRATVVLAQTVDGHPKTALYAAQDVTESKRKEARERRALKEACDAANHANASKSEFLSRMSHDIRTPMNGIIGMAAIATSHLDDKNRVLDCLNKIGLSSQHLLSLINEVLDMSKIESGKFALSHDPVSLSDMIRNLEAMIRVPAQEKGHTFMIYPLDIAHPNIIGDMVRLQQIFMNILGNAVKYTPPGGTIQMKISETPAKEQGYGCYEFAIWDNGIGMSQEYIKKIFDPFSRAEDSRTSKIEGAGLGMTITQHIVHMMNGQIHIESQPGAGSRFTVTLILKQQDTADPKPGGPPADGPLGAFGELSFDGKRVLLVEDNELNREIAEEILGTTGVIVESAVNGQEALNIFRDSPPGYYDLIFMDIQMPMMNGHEATRAIRALPRPDASSVPIVAMSANAFTDDILASRESGMNEHITKPLDLGLLMSRLRYWLERA